MQDATTQEEAAMRAFCEHVGELILWGSAIDGLLTEAIILACYLNPSPMLGPVVAELGTRAKCDILRVRAKLIEEPTWAKRVREWVDSVDVTNVHRNTVAHQQVYLKDGKLTLFAAQARKLLSSIKNGQASPSPTVDNLKQWVVDAKATYRQGQVVLLNLERANAMMSAQPECS